MGCEGNMELSGVEIKSYGFYCIENENENLFGLVLD